jgi:hypothetical protein
MKFSSVRFLFLLVFLQCLALFFLAPSFCEDKQPLVYTIQVDDMVTSGTARNIQRGLGVAEKEQADAVVILLNTPGGLVSATLEIIQDMSASNLPVLTFIILEEMGAAAGYLRSLGPIIFTALELDLAGLVLNPEASVFHLNNPPDAYWCRFPSPALLRACKPAGCACRSKALSLIFCPGAALHHRPGSGRPGSAPFRPDCSF